MAEQLGLYQKQGLEVELVILEKYEDRLSAIKNGEVDILNLTNDGVVLTKEDILDLKAFLMC